MANDAPHILLFGHPGSGKSSLLGALQQAGDSQGEALGAEVLDPSGRLPRLRDHLFAGAPLERTRTELVSYELKLKPWHVGSQPSGSFHVHDCDGLAASALMKHPDAITERTVNGLIASAVVHADLIALVVNAGSADEDLDEAFDEFLMFLERVHGRRAFEREVGGFPIELILTQCDQLFEPGDTRGRWLEETQSRLEHALRRFTEFLREQHLDDGAAFLPFGSIALHGHAVAVREPGGTEPFGVAECFRALFIRAAAHRGNVKHSQRKLRRTLWAVACAVWLLFAGAIGVSVYQPRAADPGLADRVQAYWEREPAAAERLAGRNLVRNRRMLTEFQSDPGFFALPEDLRAYVSGRLQELDDYQAYLAKLNATPAPVEARSLEELARIESTLSVELSLPAQYTWGETEAARLRDKWLADLPALRTAESAWQEWYRGLVNQALALTHTRTFEGEWRDRVEVLRSAGQRRPFDESATLPNSYSVPLPRGEALTYRTPAEFDRVYQAARDWEFNRDRLGHLRDLADALGLTSQASPRALDLPPIDVPVDPAERLKQSESDTLLSLLSFPEPARGILAARLRESLENGAKHARKRIGERLTANTPDDWRKLADSLDDPAIRAWGRLLHRLQKLDDSQAPDPVQELATFLRTPSFALDLKGFELTIPLALRVPPVIPAGTVSVTVTPAAGEPRTYTFKLAGESTTEGLNAVYRFAPEAAGAIAFSPGNGLKVELAVRSGNQRMLLVWDETANRTYPFDQFRREPKLLSAGSSEPATGVRLAPVPGSRLPRLPLLLPEGRR